jgi:hypothetical protein
MTRQTRGIPGNDWAGCLVEAKPISCSKCKKASRFDLYYYIDASAWPEFEARLRSHDGETFACEHCGNTYKVRGPLVVDFPERDLVVFATNAGDNDGVDVGFREFFEKMAGHLPTEVARAARRRPYTFVHGRKGLIALLDYFHDRPVELEPVIDPSQERTFEGAFTLQGYIYGKLFFYFPGQLAVLQLIGLTVGTAIDLERAGYAEGAAKLLSGTLDILGDSHPWLSHELGRILLVCGRASEARVWLARAAERRHCWHALTASFLDATPTRREDKEPQAKELPHALPAERLGPITRAKHTVTGVHPAAKDRGFWDFPRMAEAAIPCEYTVETVIKAHAYVLGRFECHSFLELDPSQLSEATHVGWHLVQEVSRQLLRHSESLAPIYWSTYVRSRWDVETETDPSDKEAVLASLQSAQECLRTIESDLGRIPQSDDDDGPFVFFAKGYVARDVRFFLTSSAQHIRRRLYPLLEKMTVEQSRALRHLLWRSFESGIEEARADFQRARMLAELVEYFQAAIPALADLHTVPGLPETDLRFMTHLKQFAASAFKGSVTAADLGFLSQASAALKARSLMPCGDLLAYFVERVYELGPQEFEDDYCLHRVVSSKCTTCSEESLDVVWDIINTSTRPELERRVKDGASIGPRCRYCLAELPRMSPLLYCDPVKNLYLLLCPDMNEAGEEALQNYISDYFKRLPPKHRDARENVAFCSQYIARFENDESYLVVCRVRSPEELYEIVRNRRSS